MANIIHIIPRPDASASFCGRPNTRRLITAESKAGADRMVAMGNAPDSYYRERGICFATCDRCVRVAGMMPARASGAGHV